MTVAQAVADAGDSDPEAGAYHLYATAHGYVMLQLVGLGPVDESGIESALRSWAATGLEGIGLAKG